MRVLHLIPTLFHPVEGIVGGAERYAYELARTMSRSVETTLLSFGPSEREFHDGPLRIRVLSGAWHVRGSRFNPVSARVLPEVLRADVVHCHQRHVLLATLAALAGRAARKRVFATDLGGGGWDVGAYLSTDSWFHGQLHISEFSRRVAGQGDDPRAQVTMKDGGAARRRSASALNAAPLRSRKHCTAAPASAASANIIVVSASSAAAARSIKATHRLRPTGHPSSLAARERTAIGIAKIISNKANRQSRFSCSTRRLGRRRHHDRSFACIPPFGHQPQSRVVQ